MNSSIKHLFEKNIQWSETVRAEDPDFFIRLSEQQAPEYLWIGCSDSRVPANKILGLQPGEVFVHCNVANVIVHSDLNSLSVLQYAVDILRVKHILVVGHYNCNGVKAVSENFRLGLIDYWLRHVHDIREVFLKRLTQITDPTTQLNCLCELNTLVQVTNVCKSTIVRDAWAKGQKFSIHGLIYDVADGILHDLDLTLSEDHALKDRYEKAIEAVFERARQNDSPEAGAEKDSWEIIGRKLFAGKR